MGTIADISEPASELEHLIADLSESGLLVFVFGAGVGWCTAHRATHVRQGMLRAISLVRRGSGHSRSVPVPGASARLRDLAVARRCQAASRATTMITARTPSVAS
jgi:hypothetical protein